ncbi:hypothetical protein BWK47_00610 [Synechocystis sp. CACIAM 05]|nr:hypothetical protein BWK47_00610 [Synechocystis sp. CACIAM 05]
MGVNRDLWGTGVTVSLLEKAVDIPRETPRGQPPIARTGEIDRQEYWRQFKTEKTICFSSPQERQPVTIRKEESGAAYGDSLQGHNFCWLSLDQRQ